MNLENKLKCLNDLAQKAQKQAKRTVAIVMPAIATVSLAASISYLVWSTFSQQAQLEAFDRKVQQVIDVEKRLTLEKDRLTLENAVNATRAQVIGGALVFFTAFTAWRNLKVAEEKQITERFSKAVEMLSSTSMHTRLGGIYALERIANDSDKDYPQVMEVLCAFVREESPYPPKPKKAGLVKKSGSVKGVSVAVAESEASQNTTPHPECSLMEFLSKLPPIQTDIQAVVTVIGRRKHRYGDGEWETQHLDLSKTNLQGLAAVGANLTGVDLSHTNLEGARLCRASLEGADLFFARLEGADLFFAHLKETHLCETDLSQVIGLNWGQIQEAWTDKNTKLPHLLTVKTKPL